MLDSTPAADVPEACQASSKTTSDHNRPAVAATAASGLEAGTVPSGTSSLKRTPLYDVHVALGAKMVPFAGFVMPVQYPTGSTAEHKAVRERAGLFDVSHMGEFILRGPQAVEFVNYIKTNNVSGSVLGQEC